MNRERSCYLVSISLLLLCLAQESNSFAQPQGQSLRARINLQALGRSQTANDRFSKRSNKTKNNHNNEATNQPFLFRQEQSQDWFRQTLAGFGLGVALCVGSLLLPPVANAASSAAQGYWTVMQLGGQQEKIVANEALMDYLVGTVNTMYYDNSGGAYFTPKEFYTKWIRLRDNARNHHQHHHHDSPLSSSSSSSSAATSIVPLVDMDTREGALEGLNYMISQLHDPFSKYLTREELYKELKQTNDGFLGLGAVVEVPDSNSNAYYFTKTPFIPTKTITRSSSSSKLLSATRAANLPVVTAVAPNSPAERAGLTVGDRIAAVANNRFVGSSRSEIAKTLSSHYSAENYFGYPELTVAKPVWSAPQDEANPAMDVVIGYRTSRVRMTTASLEKFQPLHGNHIVQYQLLTDSIFEEPPTDSGSTQPSQETSTPPKRKVGYIRLTRFSRASTAGYVRAIEELEGAGVQAYVIDLRNNYGGIIQEALLTASTLLRDPHAVLCYTMNARGGFTPHDAEEYIVDQRYPGYLLSREPRNAAMDQVRRENPEMLVSDGGWVPPSSFASLHEQTVRRGIHVAGVYHDHPHHDDWAQKRIVLLINEGTASSAEVFASSLHDNGRIVATVGTKTYGKGLIQHTFPMPDGGGLRLTVAEYLTPSLRHVTNVGAARFDSAGVFVGGGIRPDIYCDSKQGIPGHVGADICVGVAMDALEEADQQQEWSGDPKRNGENGAKIRRAVRAGTAAVRFAPTLYFVCVVLRVLTVGLAILRVKDTF